MQFNGPALASSYALVGSPFQVSEDYGRGRGPCRLRVERERHNT